tara:strand:- start:1340 stop:1570 length:231 start_codon:yes stop_codon:yes gene_type:complete
MDICLIETQAGTNIQPRSIHGMLWLQTHFEEGNWCALAENKVVIPNKNAEELSEDAIQAGINLNFSTVFSNSQKFR